MKIAIVTYSTKPRGGVVHSLYLSEALANLGQDVTIFSLGTKGTTKFFRKVDKRVKICIVPVTDRQGENLGKRILRYISIMSQAIEAKDFDIIHAQDCISANALPGAIRTVHHIDNFTTPELINCHEKAIRNPIAHVCVSKAVSKELLKNWGITAYVIPNGIDTQRFKYAASNDPAALNARLAWREKIGGSYVLNVGGIEPRKGSIELLRTMAELKKTHPGVKLVIAGGETIFDYRSYREEFELLSKQLGITPIILGVIPDDKLPPLVAGASVFVFPSTKEGFGMAALEAAAAKIPLVVSELEVFLEIFSQVALFANDPTSFAGAIRSCLESPDINRISAGVRKAQGMTWSFSAIEHLKLYSKVLELKSS